MPTKEELLAANKSIDEICDYIGAKSLKFLSIDGLYKAMGYEKEIILILNLLTTILQAIILLKLSMN